MYTYTHCRNFGDFAGGLSTVNGVAMAAKLLRKFGHSSFFPGSMLCDNYEYQSLATIMTGANFGNQWDLLPLHCLKTTCVAAPVGIGSPPKFLLVFKAFPCK